ncbi:MAG: sigma-70 family RNA polymerase sigma factor, partial [Clostridiales bacterium]
DIMGTDGDLCSKELESQVDRALLRMAMKKLNERERIIVELRYGINKEGEEKTQKEVADVLGISQSYISRLEKRIIKRLRKEILKTI